jgi:hypothetical protein
VTTVRSHVRAETVDALFHTYDSVSPDRVLAALWALSIHFVSGDSYVCVALRGGSEGWDGVGTWDVRPEDTVSHLARTLCLQTATVLPGYRLHLSRTDHSTPVGPENPLQPSTGR